MPALLVAAFALQSPCSAVAWDCPLGSAVIEADEGYREKLGFNMHEGPIEPIPVWNYQCVKYDATRKKWLGYRGGHVYVFPAHMVHVWAAEGELVADGKGSVTLKPRGPFVVWGEESLIGVHVDAISYDAREKVWKTSTRNVRTGKVATEEYPADEFNAYDKDGRPIPAK